MRCVLSDFYPMTEFSGVKPVMISFAFVHPWGVVNLQWVHWMKGNDPSPSHSMTVG